MGWFNDPLHFGHYPQKMRDLITGNRLPEFTDEEVEMVKGAYDFIGLNHYGTSFVHYSGEVGTDYNNDGRFW